MPSSRFLENYSLLTVPVPVPVFGGGWGLPQIGGKFRPGAFAALALMARNAAGPGLIGSGWRALIGLRCVRCAFWWGRGGFCPPPTHTRAHCRGATPSTVPVSVSKKQKKAPTDKNGWGNWSS